MIDALISLLRAVLLALGSVPVPELTAAGALVSITVLIAVTLLLLITALGAHRGVPSTPPHPTRNDERTAPLTQSDPDAAGHVRRRGPSIAAPAA